MDLLTLNSGLGYRRSETGCLLRQWREGSCLWELEVAWLEVEDVRKGREMRGRGRHRGPIVKPGQAEE